MCKKVIVTGASGYIGSAVCKLFADNGWKVGGIDLVDVPDSCCCARKCDLTDSFETKKAIDFLVNELDGIDSIICCAGQMMSNDGSIGTVTSTVMQQTLLSIEEFACPARMVVRFS